MKVMLAISAGAYLMSGVLGLAFSVRRKAAVLRLASLGALGVGVASNTLWLVEAWWRLGHPPLADLFGCLALLALCVALVSLSLEISMGIRFVGALSALGACGALVATVWVDASSRPLPLILQSPWFAPHVLSYFIAYGALSVAGLAAIACLVKRDVASAWMSKSVQIGFPFLTLGLVLGAFWAQDAYTDYWSWDPKEVWALITWLLFAAQLHLEGVLGRRGRLSAALVLVALGALYFTLLGLHLLPTARQGLHTYSGP